MGWTWCLTLVVHCLVSTLSLVDIGVDIKVTYRTIQMILLIVI